MKRIDPMHPLTVAAREVNALADDGSLSGVLEHLGMGVTSDELVYLAGQRALRTFAAVVHHYNMGHDIVKDEEMAQQIVESREWRAYSSAVIAAYMDGMTIGWRGAQIMEAERE